MTFTGKIDGEKDYFGYLRIDWRKLLTWIMKKQIVEI
jgi:hypothetical protein